MQLGILKHEMLHLVFGHLGRFPFKVIDLRTEIKKMLEGNKELQDEISIMKFKDLRELYKYLEYK